MKFTRIFTNGLNTPYDDLQFENRTSLLRNMDGSLGSKAITICVPTTWSQVASDILAQKYVRKADVPAATKPVPEEDIDPWLWRSVPDEDILLTMNEQDRFGAETDVRQIFRRIAGCWAYWGVKSKTFTNEQARIFYDEILYLLAHQIAAPNSPQWFNTGLHWAYGVSRPQRGHFRVDPDTKKCEEVWDPYVYPQAHACFIQSVDDDLCGENGIMDLWQKEARLFKFGSGTGSNFSSIRGTNEPLSCGGKSSGLISFLHIGDAAAGAIKSGGTTRRAAKMVCLDADHPDIEAFVNWKRSEEEKVAALVVGSRATKHFVKRIQQSVENARCTTNIKDAVDPLKNIPLRQALRDAVDAGVPESLLYRTLHALKTGVVQPEITEYNANFDGNGYQSVSGQNANNSVRLNAKFMDALDHDGVWSLTRRTDGSIAHTLKARELWNEIAYNAWACADPGLQFDTTINDWHTCPQSGPIRASNPCSEFMFLDDSACNLASLNLVKFLTPDGDFMLEHYHAAVKLLTVALDITVTMAQYPSAKIAQQSYDFRPLGLGYANLGSLLMRLGLPYDSDQARALAASISGIASAVAYRTSAELAHELGTFEQYSLNAEDMLRVVRNHQRASQLQTDGYEALSVLPHLPPETAFVPHLLDDLRNAWNEALNAGQSYGFRNAQVTCVAPTGTIGLLMDCDTTGIEPDFALVKFKKLVGGGYFRMINTAIPEALHALGYTQNEIDDIAQYILGHASINEAPGVNPDALTHLGFDTASIEAINQAVRSAFDIRFAVTPAVLDADFCKTTLKVPEDRLNDPTFDLLSYLGFSEKQISLANLYAFGTMTIEGAPHIKPEHLAVFDCANRCGELGTRFIPAMAHVTMMAAVQPFISGAISKTINFPGDATVSDVETVHRQAYKLGLKAIAIYRDGSKLSQPLSSTKLFNFDALREDLPTPAQTTPATPQSNGAPHANRRKLPSRRSGYTQKASINHNNIYLRTGEYADGSLGEIFIDMHKEGASFRSLMNCFAIAVSLGLQHGVPLDEYVDAFVFTRFEPSGPVAGHGTIKFATSIIDYIFRELGLTYLGKTELVHVHPEDLPDTQNTDNEFSVPYLPGTDGRRASHHHASSPTPASPLPGEMSTVNTTSSTPTTPTHKPKDARQIARLKGYEGDPCPDCGNFTMVRNGTCLKCDSCGATSGCS